jgi:hypothetical protein
MKNEKAIDTMTKKQLGWQASYAIDLVIFFCTVNNIMHGAVLYHLSFQGKKPLSYWEFFHSPENFQSLFVMLVVDTAIITLSILGKTQEDVRITGVLAWVLFVINILFADILTDLYNWKATFTSPVLLTMFLGKIIFSGLFSYLIWFFCRLKVRLKIERKQKAEFEQQLADMEQATGILHATYEQNEASIQKVLAMQQQIKVGLEQVEAREEQVEVLQKQLFAIDTQNKAMRQQISFEQIARTLYVEGKTEQLCDSVKSVSAKLGALKQHEKDYHFKRKEEEEEKVKGYKAMYSN